ncbi:DUF397 domain-containing protein [Streptomyces atratus]|uniref:DUF397 domain-containing protein n=1 Tax=Streptomyces atratus TaxID=1893 RepID=UPI0033C50925
MSEYNWQKSSYSTEGANCVNVAGAPDGTFRLRESDEPDVMLVTSGVGLSALLTSIKTDRLTGVRGGAGRLRNTSTWDR